MLFLSIRVVGFQCPSCRNAIDLTKDNIHKLPKNLALENIVIRYTEERSRNIRKSLIIEWPFTVSDIFASASAAAAEGGTTETVSPSRPSCGLCDGIITPKVADLYCVQCDVAYCHGCFGKYHPRRGALAKHRIQTPKEKSPERSCQCGDHEKEQASMFCDRCKVFVCHLCVCDGEGRHAGHKMLAPDTASNMVKVK